MLWIQFLIFWSFIPIIFSEGPQDPCATDESGVEVTSCSTKTLQVSRRILTLRDLAWLLTPHSYLVTNGNLATFSALHQSLLGSCTSDPDRLSRMRIGAFFDFRNLVLFAEPEWLTFTHNSSPPFHHMICAPEVDQEMWYSVYSTLFELPVRDFAEISTALTKLAKKDARILSSIRNFGRFTCKSNPICKERAEETTLCHPEVNGDCFKDWELVISWTDHISDTGTHTGTGFLVQGCLNGESSWAILSKVHHQGESNMEEVHKVLEGGRNREPFKSGEHCWGNYNKWL